MLKNLAKTCEIIDTVFSLKLALVKTHYPELDQTAAERRVYQDILTRKQRQWTSP